MLKVRELKDVIYQNRDLLEALEDLDRTGKLSKPTCKERVNFTIDMELMRRFRSYCKKNGHKMSNIVEQLIAEELNKEENKEKKR